MKPGFSRDLSVEMYNINNRMNQVYSASIIRDDHP
jgi:hypothetical protein